METDALVQPATAVPPVTDDLPMATDEPQWKERSMDNSNTLPQSICKFKFPFMKLGEVWVNMKGDTTCNGIIIGTVAMFIFLKDGGVFLTSNTKSVEVQEGVSNSFRVTVTGVPITSDFAHKQWVNVAEMLFKATPPPSDTLTITSIDPPFSKIVCVPRDVDGTKKIQTLLKVHGWAPKSSEVPADSDEVPTDPVVSWAKKLNLTSVKSFRKTLKRMTKDKPTKQEKQLFEEHLQRLRKEFNKHERSFQKDKPPKQKDTTVENTGTDPAPIEGEVVNKRLLRREALQQTLGEVDQSSSLATYLSLLLRRLTPFPEYVAYIMALPSEEDKLIATLVLASSGDASALSSFNRETFSRKVETERVRVKAFLEFEQRAGADVSKVEFTQLNNQFIRFEGVPRQEKPQTEYLPDRPKQVEFTPESHVSELKQQGLCVEMWSLNQIQKEFDKLSNDEWKTTNKWKETVVRVPQGCSWRDCILILHDMKTPDDQIVKTLVFLHKISKKGCQDFDTYVVKKNMPDLCAVLDCMRTLGWRGNGNYDPIHVNAGDEDEKNIPVVRPLPVKVSRKRASAPPPVESPPKRTRHSTRESGEQH